MGRNHYLTPPIIYAIINMEVIDMERYLSNIITQSELDSIQPGQFNVIKAPCGSGKTTFMFDDRILNFSRAKKHVLYLIHNKNTRDFIAHNHQDKARIFTDNSYNGWFDKRREKQGIWCTEEDEDYVHVMCYQTFAALLRNEGIGWLDDIDLIVWDEFDDFRQYYEKEVEMIRKVLPNFSREKLIALLQDGKPQSVVNFIYQIKTVILEPARIRLIAVSATPEFAAGYFSEYLNYILTGKLECAYDAKQTFFVQDVVAAIKDGTFSPQPGRRYWCYTKYVHEALAIEAVARTKKFTTISVWAEGNDKYKSQYTAEKAHVTKTIINSHYVPEPYDFIITTGALGRGVDVYDTTIQNWICNSRDYEEIVQSNRARFAPDCRYLLDGTQGWVEFVQDGFAAEYYQWHSLDELRELLEVHPIFSKDTKLKKLPTFAAVKKEYPDLFEQRKYGRAKLTQYRIKPAE